LRPASKAFRETTPQRLTPLVLHQPIRPVPAPRHNPRNSRSVKRGIRGDPDSGPTLSFSIPTMPAFRPRLPAPLADLPWKLPKRFRTRRTREGDPPASAKPRKSGNRKGSENRRGPRGQRIKPARHKRGSRKGHHLPHEPIPRPIVFTISDETVRNFCCFAGRYPSIADPF